MNPPRLVVILLASLVLAACARPATSSAPIPALSAVAEEGQPSDADPNRPVLTFDECRSQPGEVLTDRGDGSLYQKGCPDGRRELGRVKVGFEGGLCCAPAAATPVPATAGSDAKRPPCSTDQSCNDDESVSSLWGTCTALGVCECKPGFELNPRGRCQRAVR